MGGLLSLVMVIVLFISTTTYWHHHQWTACWMADNALVNTKRLLGQGVSSCFGQDIPSSLWH